MKKHLLINGAALSLFGLIGLVWLWPAQPVQAAGACVASVNIFDTKVYDPSGASTVLINAGLLSNKDDFFAAISKGTLPFKTDSSDEKTVAMAIAEIETKLCGSVGKCDTRALEIQSVCSIVSTPITTTKEATLLAKTAYTTRVEAMTPCEKTAFGALEDNNRSYLSEASVANASYYQAMAPITAAFRRAYLSTTDSGQRAKLLSDYRAANLTQRSKLYKRQTTLLSKFVGKTATLKQSLTNCSK